MLAENFPASFKERFLFTLNKFFAKQNFIPKRRELDWDRR